ncbi:MAG: hypothetical protein IKW39_06230 [Alphaproteobacteria bacterium]|nr:hypothetical protein [Alphaproteobacteria bacterium]
MLKRILIVSFFVLLAIGGISAIYFMTGDKKTNIGEIAKGKEITEVSLSFNSYGINNLKENCSSQDEIFCAIEKTVKCSINPKLSICKKGEVPSFVLGKTEDDVRPKNVSFAVTKIKPTAETRDISVYTKSQCDGSWFGLCQGTVIYSLSMKDGYWKVINVYALEE